MVIHVVRVRRTVWAFSGCLVFSIRIPPGFLLLFDEIQVTQKPDKEGKHLKPRIKGAQVSIH